MKNRIVLNMNKTFFTILGLLMIFQLSAQELITYEAPGGYKYSAHNDDFTVLVRTPKGEWKDLFEYNVEVDLDTKSIASMAYFDFSGKVEVMIKKNNGLVNKVNIRPAILGIQHIVKGNTITFSLDKPSKLSIEIDGDRLHNLHLFANALEKNKPNPKDPNVIYFGPGVHQPNDQPGNVYHIPSGKTVYIDGGAIVKAKFLISDAKDVTIRGRGIIMQPERGVEIRNSKNVIIDGLTFINPSHYTVYGGQSNDLTIRNIKSFSSKGWSDGIDLMSCSNVEIDDVFMRNSDDCIAIYGHRWDFYGDAKNYLIHNSVLWADIAHPTNIGLHGDAEGKGNLIENITFSDIDILEHDEDDRNYQGCLAISASDNNLVKNIRYENIRIDDIQEGQLFNFRVYFNEKYSNAPGKGIQNLVLSNISYNGRPVNPSLLEGFSKDRLIQDVEINNFKINGELIQEDKTNNYVIKRFAQNINFK
ncbi:Glycosyl hydrolases family 28 [Flavobacterium glycines]|uniref:Glycosyl hydrolases family 28 n=3 Tax=Flavobacterium glycines TaxID=551990 RepID=A0A1G8SIN1_9FLAO|nr:Glycosyl hydrolases family 28 [Flavobacterium glycines]